MAKQWGHDHGVGATALWIAYQRAEEEQEDDPLFSDPFAKRFAGKEYVERLFMPWQHFFYLGDDGNLANELKAKYLIPCLGRRYLANFKNAPSDPMRLQSTISNFGKGVRKRTFLIDTEVRGAIEAGVRQFVMIANGFDLRCLRLDESKQCTWWLIDQPAVLEHLLDRVPELSQNNNVKLLPVKLGNEAWNSALVGAGFREDVPAFFLAEGLTPYLNLKENESLFADVSTLMSTGSFFVGDCCNAGLLENPMFQPLLQSLADSGAPWLWGPATTAELKAMMRRHSLEVVTNCAAQDPTQKAHVLDWLAPHFPQHRLFVSVKCDSVGKLPSSYFSRATTSVCLPGMRPTFVHRQSAFIKKELVAS